MTKPTILGSTWGDGLFAVTGDGRSQEIANQPVRGLAPDGRGGALAIICGHSLRRRAPGGEWTTVATSEFDLSCCMAVRDRVYVGTEDARLMRLMPGSRVLEPVDGFDRVPGRDTWFAGSAIVNGQRLGPPLGIRSLAANSNGSVLFANVHVGGVPRSIDGGTTWHPTVDINSDVHEVRAHPSDPDLVVAASAIGLWISRDSGATWAVEHEGLQASHCYAVAFSGDDLLVSASTDFFVPDGRIYRRSVKPGGIFSAVGGGVDVSMQGFVDTGCIATHGPSLAVADRAGNVYGSDDFGRSWSRRSTGLPAPSSVLIG